MKLIIFIILFTLIILNSCNKTSKKEIVYSKDYTFRIETQGCIPGSSKTIAVLYNTPQYYLVNYKSFKPHHLYITSQPAEGDSTKSKTFDLPLAPETEDSVFYYIHKYVMDFNIDNKEVFINGQLVKNVIMDGACLSVELEYENKSIKCVQSSLEGIYQASPQITKLLRIINSRVPDEFKLH
jgi:hypothetical protein